MKITSPLAALALLTLWIQAEMTYKIEAEGFALNHWKSVPEELESSGCAVLESGVVSGNYFNDEESKRMPLTFAEAKNYQLWIRFRKYKENKVGFMAVVRDDQGLVISVRPVNAYPVLGASKKGGEAGTIDQKDEYVWENIEVAPNRPMVGQISFVHLYGPPTSTVKARIDCVVVTDNPKLDLRGYAKFSSESATAVHDKSAEVDTKGLLMSRGYHYDPYFFSGWDSQQKIRFTLTLINCFSQYTDFARAIHLGFNHDHYWEMAKVQQSYGLNTKMFVNPFYPEQDAELSAYLTKNGAPPSAKFSNLKGEPGTVWSLSYPPLIQAMKEQVKKEVLAKRENELTDRWVLNGEQGGFLDTSEFARKAFLDRLKRQYRTVENLNQKWNARYKAWEEIQIPKSPSENFACWSDFYTFSSDQFIEVLKIKKAMIQENDPFKRPIMGMLSNSDLLMPQFISIRPLDTEKYFNEVVQDQPYVGTDLYCIDESLACELEILKSFSNGRPVRAYEWNVHTPDPRVMARSTWMFPIKGAQEISVFQAQEGVSEIGKQWSFYNHCGQPKEKLGALSDVAHEINRLSKFLMAAKPVDVVKPIGIYYSKKDLALSPTFESMWSCGPNNPYHIYSSFRSAGYQVTWITPKQVNEGKLDSLSALVLFDAYHLPVTVTGKIEKWVKNGGVTIADGYPGIWDDYGHSNEKLFPVFGIKLPEVKKNVTQQSMEESTQGYGEVSMAAINASNLATTMGEISGHWYSNHPLLAMVGDFQLAGYGAKEIELTTGEAIGVAYGKKPGLVIHSYGKGNTLYFSMMLGSIYDSDCSTPSYDSRHSGTSYIKILDKFLEYSKVKKSYQIDKTTRFAAAIRVERPLVDDRGNSFIGLLHYLPEENSPFTLKLNLNHKMEQFTDAYWIQDGTRKITKLNYVLDQKQNAVTVQIPSFQTHGGIILSKEMGVMISNEVIGAQVEKGLLPHLKPGSELTLKVSPWNMSTKEMKDLTLEIYTPKGWRQSIVRKEVGTLKSGESRDFEVTIKAPELNLIQDAIPLMARVLQGDKVLAVSSQVAWFDPL